jgi:hypothetical protein
MATTWQTCCASLGIRFSSGGNFLASPARRCLLVFTMQAVILCPVRSRAQENYEIQVYGSELVAPKHTMLELDSNFTGSTDNLIAKMILGFGFNFWERTG